MEREIDALRASYDDVAQEYVSRIYDELRHKPLDRELLDRYAGLLRGAGSVWDIGCGPGHVARYLDEREVDVSGIDLSLGMVEQARRLNPGIRFSQADMLALDAGDATLAGIVAFYSIIHIPRDRVVAALREMARVLKPGGRLLLAFHLGDEVIHLDDLWGVRVSLDFVLFQTGEMQRYLESAGFAIESAIERDPYEGVEYPSRRAYILARKP